MAHRLKWLLGMSAALIVITLLIRRVELSDWIESQPADVQRKDALGEELRRAHARLRDAVYADSLQPLLPAEPGVRVILATFVDPAVAASVREAAAQQLAEMNSVRARAGVFVVPAGMGADPRLSRSTMRYTYYAGGGDSDPYCFVVAAVHPPNDALSKLTEFGGLRAWRDSVAEPLGPCFYWTRHGAPGLHVQQWLREAGYRREESALLADVERAFGPERFADFWRSDEAVDVAFANAFGEPLGEWIRQWALRYYPSAPPVRAAFDVWSVLLSLLTVAALCGAAFMQAGRRQIR